MTDISQAFGDGLYREQALFGQREQWTEADWRDRKLFIEEALKDEENRLWCAELEGRLMAVCVEGMVRFER